MSAEIAPVSSTAKLTADYEYSCVCGKVKIGFKGAPAFSYN